MTFKFDDDEIDKMREFVDHMDDYIIITLKGQVAKILGKEEAYKRFAALDEKYGNDIRAKNKELRNIIDEFNWLQKEIDNRYAGK